MSKPVIIFGAGASHDVINREKFDLLKELQPPLTNQLFDKKWDNIIIGNPDIESLPQIRQWSNTEGLGLENFLEKFKNEISNLVKEKNKKERYLELIKIEIYLKNLLTKISDVYLRAKQKTTTFRNGSIAIISGTESNTCNNYITFLRKLEENFEEASIITFNYDLFLDRAFNKVFGYNYSQMSSYYENPFKLYKVHGSVNWFYEGKRFSNNNDNIYSIYENVISNPSYKNKIFIERTSDHSPNSISIPCLAIPLPQDKKLIVEEHKDLITKDLKKTDRIVMIGWSASDKYFVDLINKNIKDKQAKLIIISKSLDTATTIGETLSENKQWTTVHMKDCGFSGLWTEEDILKEIFN